MEVSAIIAGIDEQIAKLQRARSFLESELPPVHGKPSRDRLSGSKKIDSAGEMPVPSDAPVVPSKHKVSPEGRQRIADAMKRRWAEHRKKAQ